LKFGGNSLTVSEAKTVQQRKIFDVFSEIKMK